LGFFGFIGLDLLAQYGCYKTANRILLTRQMSSRRPPGSTYYVHSDLLHSRICSFSSPSWRHGAVGDLRSSGQQFSRKLLVELPAGFFSEFYHFLVNVMEASPARLVAKSIDKRLEPSLPIADSTYTSRVAGGVFVYLLTTKSTIRRSKTETPR
jgi:hypothetical protein